MGKINVNESKEKLEEIRKITFENPDLLNKLDDKKLKVLDAYYDYKIAEFYGNAPKNMQIII